MDKRSDVSRNQMKERIKRDFDYISCILQNVFGFFLEGIAGVFCPEGCLGWFLSFAFWIALGNLVLQIYMAFN